MKNIVSSLKISLVIIGAVLGAGFVSGKEIYEFFNGQNIYAVMFTLFVLFFGISFMALSNGLNRSRIYNKTSALFLIGNFIIGSGMFSAIDSLFAIIFPWSYKLSIFSFLTAIFSSLVTVGGKKWLKTVNAILVPVMILVIATFVFIPYKSTVDFSGGYDIMKIFSYCGLNLFLALPVLSGLGEGESRKVSLTASVLSSLTITILLYMIFSCLKNQNFSKIDLPVLFVVKDNGVLYVTYVFVLFIGILTTLLSAHYTVFNFFDNSRKGNVFRVIFTVAMFVFSKIGFGNIVSIVYPYMGGAGIIAIFIYAFELFFFPKSQPEGTLSPLKSTK